MIIQTVDLNLFALFEVMMRTRSVSASARELGVTPSAVSHGLARLRRVMKDELFVPSPKGMQPTSRARELGPNVFEILSQIETILMERSFHPSTEKRLFTVAANDHAADLIVPYLARCLLQQAPGSQLRVLPQGRLDVVQMLDEGRIDLVLGWLGTLPNRINRQALVTEHEALVVRRGHPLIDLPLTRQGLRKYGCVVVELTGSEHGSPNGVIDDRGSLRRTWIERFLSEERRGDGGHTHVVVTVPNYANVAPLVRLTDMVASLPRRMAEHAARHEDLVILDLPWEPLAITVERVWHDRAVNDPGLRWLVAQTETATQDMLREAKQLLARV